MSDERCHFTVSAAHRDTFIDAACEECNAVLEEVMGDLHDVFGRQVSHYASNIA